MVISQEYQLLKSNQCTSFFMSKTVISTQFPLSPSDGGIPTFRELTLFWHNTLVTLEIITQVVLWKWQSDLFVPYYICTSQGKSLLKMSVLVFKRPVVFYQNHLAGDLPSLRIRAFCLVSGLSTSIQFFWFALPVEQTRSVQTLVCSGFTVQKELSFTLSFWTKAYVCLCCM